MLPLLEARLCTRQQRDMVWRTLRAMPLRLLERVLPWLAGNPEHMLRFSHHLLFAMAPYVGMKAGLRSPCRPHLCACFGACCPGWRVTPLAIHLLHDALPVLSPGFCQSGAYHARAACKVI